MSNKKGISPSTLSAILSSIFAIICVILSAAITDRALKWKVILLFAIPYLIIGIYWINDRKKKYSEQSSDNNTKS